MRSSLSLLLALAPACVVLEFHEGNGVSATELREVGAFDALANEGGFDVFVTLGEPATVAVTCDENLLDDIEIEVEGDELVVRSTWEGRAVSLLPRTECFVQVVTPDLRALVASGSGDVALSGPSAVSLDAITVSGSGDVLVSAPLVALQLSVVSTGSGEAALDQVSVSGLALVSTGSGGLSVNGGDAGALELQGTGSGDVLVAGVQTESAQVLLTGSGDGEISVNRSLEATLTGSGDLTVWGDPAQRDLTETGSGEVRFLE